MRILIAVPTFETIRPETFKSIYDLDTHGHECAFEFVKGYDCAAARNKIAQMAITGNYNYCLMIDSDMLIPRNALQTMLDSGAWVTLAPYQRRGGKRGETPIYQSQYHPYYKHDMPNKPPFVTARAGGFGCALVKVDAFRQLSFPYFQYVWDTETNLVSEDIYFCDKARDAGLPIVCATHVWCGHILAAVDNGEQ